MRRILTKPTWNYGENWKEIRRAVLERDNYICQDCGGLANTAHHLYYKSNSLEELTSLCQSCHWGIHGRDKAPHWPIVEKELTLYQLLKLQLQTSQKFFEAHFKIHYGIERLKVRKSFKKVKYFNEFMEEIEKKLRKEDLLDYLVRELENSEDLNANKVK